MCPEQSEGGDGLLLRPVEQVVDASRSIEAVHEEIRALSEDTICSAAQRPLGVLWK